MMSVAGVLGYLIGIVTVWQIQVTSPLTHNISGTAKACLQTLLAYFIWKNWPTVGSVIGVLLGLGGSLLYAYVRVLEEQARDAEKNGGGYKAVTTTTDRERDVQMQTLNSNGKYVASTIAGAAAGADSGSVANVADTNVPSSMDDQSESDMSTVSTRV